ncbi:MAG: dihydrofolate reductase [Evtepia sp.]
MNLIVAVDKNWGIGKENELLIHIPADLKRFRELTLGHTVILGRKTIEGFPNGKPLKDRRNLVLSRTLAEIAGAEVFQSVETLLSASEEDAFVIGGESVYAQLLPYCDTAYVTWIDKEFEADRFFCNLENDVEWAAIEEAGPFEYEGIPYHYVIYKRNRQFSIRGVSGHE